MPLREDILEPIPGENPSGTDERYSPTYDKIKEARREDDDLPQGAWVHERKVADHRKVIDLSQELIATKTKDLQLAVWLTLSLVPANGFPGLNDGLGLFHGLIERFWETLYPELDEGDPEQRADLLGSMSKTLETGVKKVPLCRDGYPFYRYQESRSIIYEENAKTKDEKAGREARLKEGKIPPEAIDKSFNETPKVFYAEAEKNIDRCLEALGKLDALSREKFGVVAPSFGKLRSAIEDIRQVVHKTLEKKRETDPDPIEIAPPEPEMEEEAVTADGLPSFDGLPVNSTPTIGAQEPGDRGAAIANVAVAAAFLRRTEPFSPAPYLLLRGLRWGELRASQDPAVLDAAPTDVRRRIKALAMNNKWKELLETAENVMAMPYGRAWLDLQRFVIEACVALGLDYEPIAIAIRSELRALLRDLPQLLDATLSDDTPAANADTQAWLRELLAEPAEAVPSPNAPRLPVKQNPQEPGWQKKFIDPQSLASEAMRLGKPQRAFEILHSEIERQRSGRGRFQRKMQLAQICIAAGKDTIAQPLLDDILAALDLHKLEEWEDPGTVASTLAFLMQSSKKVQADAKLKQAMFERICRLDPVQALSV
jgi:type VI secretion system protein ImpA